MKKSVIFTISVIYLLSIFIVTLFGMKIKIDQFAIYMTDLQITSYDRISIKGVKTKNLDWDELKGYSEFQIEYEYKPDNATYPDKIKFALTDHIKVRDGAEVQIATITSFGKVVFTSIGTVRVKVYATDGSAKEDTIQISCRVRSTV